MTDHEKYMQRCLDLAVLGAGYVAPNPMVGAVLVHRDRIIGEGYHQFYGGPHAEVNCIQSVSPSHEPLIKESTLYVSLEPCAHHGKTPPCADLIISRKIPRVVIGCRDPFPLVDGRGMEKLTGAGVEVVVGPLEEACRSLNKRFFVSHQSHRPYIVLKWAQTANQYIANPDFSRIRISNEFTNRLVHKWRSEEQSILVGTQTAMKDDPELSTRLWKGPSAVRLVLDLNLRLPHTLALFDRRQPTIIFNYIKEEKTDKLHFYQLAKNEPLIPALLKGLQNLNIQSVLVEGGSRLLQTFIDEGIWDEARVITNTEMVPQAGLPSPRLGHARLEKAERLFSDEIKYYRSA